MTAGCTGGRRGARRTAAWIVAALLGVASTVASAQSARPLPVLTGSVNDFGGVLDAGSVARIDQTIRSLQAASGDVLVVATVPTVEPFADVREYAEQLFQNGGRGIGERGKDNGLLILVALKERRVWVEVGYGLEPFITDGFAGQVSRELMTPAFREGRYGEGVLAGTNAVAARIAQGRGVALTGVAPVPVRSSPRQTGPSWSDVAWVVLIIVIVLLTNRSGGGPRSGLRRGRHGGMWTSGVGPFGGGFGGGGGGGLGGGFGGFGGGRSGGGGGGGGW